MKYLFYSLAIFPLIWELMCIFELNRVHNFLRGIDELKGKKVEEYTTNQILIVVLMWGYFAWEFVGLFTANWFYFLILLLMGFAPKKNKYVKLVDSVLSVIIIIFIVLNAFHFHIVPNLENLIRWR